MLILAIFGKHQIPCWCWRKELNIHHPLKCKEIHLDSWKKGKVHRDEWCKLWNHPPLLSQTWSCQRGATLGFPKGCWGCWQGSILKLVELKELLLIWDDMSQELQIHPWKRHFLMVTLQFLWRKHSGTPVWPICLNIKVFRPSTPTFLAAGELGDDNNQRASCWVDLAGAPAKLLLQGWVVSTDFFVHHVSPCHLHFYVLSFFTIVTLEI